MNDLKLVTLILESPLEELTLEQIHELRMRLPDSVEVQAALAERLRMEQHLVDALGASEDTPDQFMAKVLDRKQRQASRGRRRMAAAVVLLVIASGVGLTLLANWSDLSPGRIPPQRTVADVPRPDPPAAKAETADAQEDETDPAIPPHDPVAATDIPPTPALPTKPEDEESSPQQRPAGELPLAQIEPISFARLTSLPAAGRHDSLTSKQLEQWWEKASPRLPTTIVQYDEQNRPQSRLEGWFRMRGSLPDGGVLRLQVSDLEKVRFHFYHQDSGVTVMRHRHDYRPWYAYQMQRSDDGVAPRDLRLLANDGYREHRSEARHYEPLCIYFDSAHQEIVFYRGDVELIRAPLPGPPTDIYWEGESVIRQMQLLPVAELPPRYGDYPVQVEIDRPATLDWRQQLGSGTHLEEQDDGALMLKADSAQENSWICLPLPGYGLRMVDLHLTGMDVAHSVFLAEAPSPTSAEERPIATPRDGLIFSRNQQTGNLVARFSNCWDTRSQSNHDPLDFPSPEVKDQAWVRLLAGGGQVRGWISLDGRTWALLPSENNNATGDFTWLGLSTARLEGEYALTLRRIVVRELPQLTALASAEEWEMANRVPFEKLRRLPEDDKPIQLEDGSQVVPTLPLRLRRLAGMGISYEQLQRLAEEVLAAAESHQQQWQLLSELLVLTKTWPLGHHEKRFLQWAHDRLEQQFQRTLSEPERLSFVEFRHRLLNLPTQNRDHRTHLSSTVLNAEVLHAIAEGRWDDVRDACETIERYYGHDPNRARRDFPILPWAGGLAAGRTDRPDVPTYLAEERSTPLLVEDLSKEAYNISAELTAALDGGAIADACRLITQIPHSATQGLAPSADDPNHLFSVPTAIAMAIQRHDQLRHQMRSEYSDLAQLRLNAAIARGERAAVELVTLQFFDTPGAAQAHLWLGDQATAAGDFATSLEHYLKASRSDVEALQQEAQARLAMLGHSAAEPPESWRETPVTVGTLQLSAASLVDTTAPLRGSIQLEASADDGNSAPAWPIPGELKPTSVVLEGQWGGESNRVPRAVSERHIDWQGRQLGISVHRGSAYVCNRQQLMRIDLTNHEVQWSQKLADSEQGKAHDFSLTANRPLVLQDQVVVRLLREKGFALYCFDRETGQPRWESNLEGQLVLATDPVAIQGRVLLVTLREVSHSTYAARLAQVDLASGEILDGQPLFRVRKWWFERGIGHITPHQEQLFIQLGGVLAACDLSGRLQWVRQQLTFPPQIDDRWGAQQKAQLERFGSVGVAFHAGMLQMEAFDLATGQFHWNRPADQVLSIAKLDESHLLVEEPTRWVVLDAADGQTSLEWEKPPEVIQWQHVGDNLLGVQRQEASDDSSQEGLKLVRFDPRTGEGQILGQLKIPLKGNPRLSPYFCGKGKWYAWLAEELSSDRRKLVAVEPPD